MRRAKSLRIGVHHADAVVWEPVCRTHLRARVAVRVAEVHAARLADVVAVRDAHAYRRQALVELVDVRVRAAAVARSRDRVSRASPRVVSFEKVYIASVASLDAVLAADADRRAALVQVERSRSRGEWTQRVAVAVAVAPGWGEQESVHGRDARDGED